MRSSTLLQITVHLGKSTTAFNNLDRPNHNLMAEAPNPPYTTLVPALAHPLTSSPRSTGSRTRIEGPHLTPDSPSAGPGPAPTPSHPSPGPRVPRPRLGAAGAGRLAGRPPGRLPPAAGRADPHRGGPARAVSSSSTTTTTTTCAWTLCATAHELPPAQTLSPSSPATSTSTPFPYGR